MLDPRIHAISRDIERAGGQALVVGGWVRDRLLGIDSKDVDIEVLSLDIDALKRVLSSHGDVIEVGRAFGVLKVKGLDADFSLPRTDSKVGPGHRGFDVQTDPNMDFAAAARRRDLTINSIGFDPITGEYLDPYNGQEDLAAGLLRATDAAQFSEDPLRGLRAAQFAARLDMQPTQELVDLCRTLDLSEISAERIYDELAKLLMKGRTPSRGFEFMREAGLLDVLPEVAALIGVPQSPRWHPEGDVWVHTMMVLDAAVALREAEDDLGLMMGALCHDLGKPGTTEIQDEAIRSHGHDTHGAGIAKSFLERLRAPKPLVRQVVALVEHHLAPMMFIRQNAGAGAYRRLARELEAAGASMSLLARLARADHLGRTTEDAMQGVFPAGDEFLRLTREYQVEHEAPKDLVLGRHLIDRGIEPGPRFGWILNRCRERQDERPWEDAGALLDQVLAEIGVGDWSDELF